MTEISTGTYESKADAEKSEVAYVRSWLAAIELAEKEEDDWRKSAEKVTKLYRGEGDEYGKTAFNILFTNVETIAPSIYNSSPAADIRRRYGEDNPVARQAADILERGISVQMDQHDFDSVMKLVVRDGEIVGRGIPRVRYMPTLQQTQGDDGQPVEQVVAQSCTTELVPWKYFRRGPGREWKDIPWVAFGEFLSKEDLEKLNPELAASIPLSYSSRSDTGKTEKAPEENTIYQRAYVWQIWDKETRRVITICPEYAEAPLDILDDPLELTDFFPIPAPYRPIITTDSQIPVIPFEQYKSLAEELDEVTRRIGKLVKQLRPRAAYAGNKNDVEALAEADDGELVPFEGSDGLLSGQVKMADLLAWYPLEPTVIALKQLNEQREQIKQQIFELTGISDIQRGATDPNETLGAQQIKEQWGSLRIQERQNDMSRMVRDVFRIMAEIMSNKFSMENLLLMTGIMLPTAEQKAQAEQVAKSGQPVPEDLEAILKLPSIEEVEQLLRNDVLRTYRVDIESDSTVRGDLTRNQAMMNNFLQGTAQFASAMAPLAQQAPATMPAIIQLYAAFARQYKLGRQAESALENLFEEAEKAAKEAMAQPAPVQPGQGGAGGSGLPADQNSLALIATIAQSIGQAAASMGQAAAAMNTAKQIVRDPNTNQIVGLAPVQQQAQPQPGVQ